MKSIPRGIRTNNPGNLRASIPWWNGQTGVDPYGMCIFSTPDAGFRALCLTIVAYQRRHDCRTLTEILYRYAPEDKGGDNNDTEAYIADVAAQLRINPDLSIDFAGDAELLAQLAAAICRHENGSQPWPELLVANAAALALS